MVVVGGGGEVLRYEKWASKGKRGIWGGWASYGEVLKRGRVIYKCRMGMGMRGGRGRGVKEPGKKEERGCKERGGKRLQRGTMQVKQGV